jgi:hypothetical protein
VRRLAASLATLAAFASVPLQAQAPLPPEAEESLKCAIWASYYSVAFEGQEEAAAFTYAFNFFVGRYEGLTGRGIDEGVDEALVLEAAESIEALDPICSAHMEAYGERMVDFGEAITAIGEKLPDETPAPGTT